MIGGFLAALLGRRPRPLQAGALCLHQGKVLLISSLDTGRWIIPKGWPMAGRTLAGAAMQEAWEEAGIRGRLRPDPVGSFSYDKRGKGGLPRETEVSVYLIDVTGVADSYPEAGRRERRFLPPAEAADLVQEPGLKQLLRAIPGSARPPASRNAG